jgi:hypothetical protein
VNNKFKGGANIDLGQRQYGMKRVRATYPFGSAIVYPDYVELSVSKRFLPRSLPLPLRLHRESIRIFLRHGPLKRGVGFRTESTTHYFLTLRPERLMKTLRGFGYEETD